MALEATEYDIPDEGWAGVVVSLTVSQTARQWQLI